jgi:hypothetical protein
MNAGADAIALGAGFGTHVITQDESPLVLLLKVLIKSRPEAVVGWGSRRVAGGDRGTRTPGPDNGSAILSVEKHFHERCAELQIPRLRSDFL